MKTIVVYKSETGFTKKYAEWIAKELGADIFNISKVNIDILKSYDTIIYGGYLHAIGIGGVKLITKNLDKLKDKKLIVFATGATPPRVDDINKVRNKNFNIEQQKYVKFFYMRGGFNYEKLGFFDKLLMNMLRLMLKSKKELSPDERGMLLSYDKPIDFSDKRNIKDLILYVRK